MIVIKLYFICCLCLAGIKAKKSEVKPDWAKKDIRDFNDVDMERLLDQWEVLYMLP